jgi:uncharacterized membrane protein YhaH (DUF805 family)
MLAAEHHRSTAGQRPPLGGGRDIMVGFFDAIRGGFERFGDVAGRSTRAEFWWWWGFASLLSTITEGSLLNTPVILVLVVPTMTVIIRRLHDSGRSAWALLYFLIPAVGLLVLIYLLVQPSDPGSNRYGAPTVAPARGGAGAVRGLRGTWDGGDPGPGAGPAADPGGWPHGGEEPPRSSGWDDLPPPPPTSR